jgi:hypothetical protein
MLVGREINQAPPPLDPHLIHIRAQKRGASIRHGRIVREYTSRRTDGRLRPRNASQRHVCGVAHDQRGVSLGSRRLMPATDANQGYWESSALRLLNGERLPGSSAAWSAAAALTQLGISADLRLLSIRARLLFPSVYRTSVWIWKDPRNCLSSILGQDSRIRPSSC